MSEISTYLLSIVGATLLYVLLDLIVSDGKIAKYTKSIMGLVLVFVIVSPLPKLLKTKLDFSSVMEEGISLNQEYQEVFAEQQKSLMEKRLINILKEEGYEGVELEIWGNNVDGNLQINYIFVDLKNLVISQNLEHINYYEAIKNLLIKHLGVDEGQVIFGD